MDFTLSDSMQKIAMGIALAAPIGPVSIEMIKRGLHHGFWSSFSVRIGGVFGNLLCLLVTYIGIFHFLSNPLVLDIMGVLGGGLLIYLGVQTVRKGVKDLNLDAPINMKNSMVWGFYLAIANPIAFIFWPGLFAASIDPATGITIQEFILSLFILVGVLFWGLGLSLVLTFCHKVLNKTIIVVISKLAGIAMVCYGIFYGFKVFSRIFML